MIRPGRLEGLFMGLIFAMITQLNKLRRSVLDWLLSSTVSLEILDEEAMYGQFLEWLCAPCTNGSLYRGQHIMVRRNRQFRARKHETKEYFIPRPSKIHYFWFEGKKIALRRIRRLAIDPEGEVFEPIFMESLTLTTFDRDVKIFRRLMAAVASFSASQGQTRAVVCRGGAWCMLGYGQPKRPLSSVFLAGDILEKLRLDIQGFLDSSDWYEDLGVPYHRGYILHGPSGNGKHAAIRALADHFGARLAVLNVSCTYLSDSCISRTLRSVSWDSWLLLEDVDVIFRKDTSEEGSRSSCTKSGLTLKEFLRALDGSGISVLFVVTNNLDRICPSFFGSGKSDVIHEIGHAEPFQVQAMFQKFRPSATTEEALSFANAVYGRFGSHQFSMARLQTFFASCKHDTNLAVHEKVLLADLVENYQKSRVFALDRNQGVKFTRHSVNRAVVRGGHGGAHNQRDGRGGRGRGGRR